MNKPAKVRAIYHELRAAVGDEFPANELLQAAGKLVELASVEDLEAVASIREPRPTREELPVDKAIADGGWLLLSQGSNIINATFGGEEIDAEKRMKLNEYGIGIAA
jgi:hypothetical protein